MQGVADPVLDQHQPSVPCAGDGLGGHRPACLHELGDVHPAMLKTGAPIDGDHMIIIAEPEDEIRTFGKRHRRISVWVIIIRIRTIVGIHPHRIAH